MENPDTKTSKEIVQEGLFSLADYSVNDLIPHSPPMVLIERIVDFGNESLVAEITIVEDCKFYDSDLEGVPAWVGIEYMSQAIAAFAGIHAKKESRAIKLGFLLGTRKYQMVKKVFKINKTYGIIVKQLYKDDSGLASFECKIVEQSKQYLTIPEDNICVQTKLNVFETNELQDIAE